MEIILWIRFIVGAACMAAGVIFYVIQLIGLFRFKYVLTRIHASAIGDTLGTGLILVGAIIMNGIGFASLKIAFIDFFLFMTAPVSAHMVAKAEVMSKKNPEECCNVENYDSKGTEERKS